MRVFWYTKLYMKPNSVKTGKFFIKENIWIVLLSYVLIILFTRTALYFSSARWGIFSGLIIKGVHYHHYVWGYFILLAGVVLYRTSFRTAGLMAIGIGTGYIFDELMMLFSLGTIGYWSLWNLLPITLGLLGLNFIFFRAIHDNHRVFSRLLNRKFAADFLFCSFFGLKALNRVR